MKLKILAIVIATVSTPAFARVKPITAKESKMIMEAGQNSRLVGCMVVFKFDFFANQLGLTVDNKQMTEEAQFEQFRAFLNTGKLEVRDPKMRFPAELKQHCASVAQTAVEMLAIKMFSNQPVDGENH